jgi:hypothetical protein
MKKSEWKTHIDKFINSKYDFIRTCAKNIMKGKKLNYDDLVSELVLFIYDNQERLLPYLSNDPNTYNDLTAFSISWMKLQAKYSTTPFSKKYNNMATEWEMPEIATEVSADLDEADYIKDLKTIYTDDQVENILKIHEIYPTLSKSQQILFKAYFLEDLSYDKIKEKYHFFRKDKNGKVVYYKSKKSIYNLMLELKNEIKGKL